MKLKIGRKYSLACRDLAEVSRFYQAVRNASGEGTGTFPEGKVYADGRELYRVSFNGRVWSGEALIAEAAQ